MSKDEEFERWYQRTYAAARQTGWRAEHAKRNDREIWNASWHAATEAQKQRDLAAVEAETELPGDMPDWFWQDWQKLDRDHVQIMLRRIVHDTKESIARRISGDE